MDASNRILFATIHFTIALAFVASIFAYPAYYKFIPRRLALGTRIVFFIAAAGSTAYGVFVVRGAPPGIASSSFGLVSSLIAFTILIHRPWTERYYREERDREIEQLRVLGPQLLDLDGRSPKR
jgi:hypothetical protein